MIIGSVSFIYFIMHIFEIVRYAMRGRYSMFMTFSLGIGLLVSILWIWAKLSHKKGARKTASDVSMISKIIRRIMYLIK